MVLFYFFTRLVQYMHYIYYRKRNNTTIFFTEVFTMLDFNNNIFRTENVTLASGRKITWVLDCETGERIFFVDNQADLDTCISDLMRQRLNLNFTCRSSGGR